MRIAFLIFFRMAPGKEHRARRKRDEGTERGRKERGGEAKAEEEREKVLVPASQGNGRQMRVGWRDAAWMDSFDG